MPHLDDGLLHAYLDDELPQGSASAAAGRGGTGSESDAADELRAPHTRMDVDSHLSVCAECRARLDDARSSRDAATRILAGAGPADVAVPSFEEVRARASSRGSGGDKRNSREAGRRRHDSSRSRWFAWAATVALAVAVGWYARSTSIPTDLHRYATEDEARSRPIVPAAAAEEPDIDASGGGLQHREPDVAREESEHYVEVDEPVREQVALGFVGDTARPVGPLAERAESAVTAAAEGKGRQEAPDIHETARMLPRAAAADAPFEPTLSRTVAGRGLGAAVTWTSVDEATAVSVLDGPVPTVEGIRVIGYATSNLQGRQAIRVHQQLEKGHILELIVMKEDDTILLFDAKENVEPLTAAAVAGDSVNSITVQHGGLNIRISAPLAADSLRSLGESLGRGG